MRLLGMAVLFASVLQCCSVNRNQIDIGDCSLSHFTLAMDEHIIEKIEKPIIMRSIKAKITNMVGGWPDNTQILFEVRRNEIGAKTIRSYADSEGNVEVPQAENGHYCFKATVNGWRSVMGIIKVDKRAEPAKMILIVMLPGV